MAECLYIKSDFDIKNVAALREQGSIVLDSEGTHCDTFVDREIRSACQCKYRKEPLIKFRKDYEELLKNKPVYHNRMVCYQEGEQGISVNFAAYEQIKSWCQ